jgi:hypothetical protein
MDGQAWAELEKLARDHEVFKRKFTEAVFGGAAADIERFRVAMRKIEQRRAGVLVDLCAGFDA